MSTDSFLTRALMQVRASAPAIAPSKPQEMHEDHVDTSPAVLSETELAGMDETIEWLLA